MSTIPDKDQRTWAMLCHLSSFAGYVIPMGNIIAPLLLWLLKKEEWPFVDEQGKESVNFQISWTIYMGIAFILCFFFIGFPILIGLVIIHIVLVIQATIKSNDGDPFRYPFSLRLIR